MVGRSKPQRIERKPSVEINAAENLYLKAKNAELAKALADSKSAYSQIVEARDFLQRELFSTNLRNTKLENYIKSIDSAARACINSIVSSSNHVTQIVQITNSVQRLTSLDETQSFRPSVTSNSATSSPGPPNKTQAVKPMIGGHVIFRPTINLRRVNEIPSEEIQRLQSGDSNHDNSRQGDVSSVNSGEDSPPASSSFRCRSSNSNVRTFRSQLVNTVAEPPDNQDGEEEELTDRSSEVSDITPTINNRLDPVEEESEDEVTNSLTSESHINSLTNTSTSSLNIPGSNSQVPLLSGVFRDVRVYLSPMPNVAQYLDPRQNVTKERGSSKTLRSKQSRSIHSKGSSNNTRSTSAENRKYSPNNSSNSAQTMNINNSAQNINGTSSAEVSCNSTFENSLLTSTKICSPRALHSALPESSSYLNDDSSWSNIMNKFEQSPQSQNTCIENGRSAFSDVSIQKRPGTKERRSDSSISKVRDTSRKSYPISSSKCMTSTTDYDPLEGPSTMLDSFNTDTEIKAKIETLSGLGLTPTFMEINSSTPQAQSSPAAAVLQRREKNANKSNELTAKQAKSCAIKSLSLEKKKISLGSSKVAKVIIRRMSFTKGQISISPQRKTVDKLQKKSSETLRKKSVKDIRKKNSNSSLKRKSTDSSSEDKTEDKLTTDRISLSDSDSESEVTQSNYKPHVLKKRGRKPKEYRLKSITDRKSETSPSPQKRGRPRRIAQHASLKEPSLRKKMRRSK